MPGRGRFRYRRSSPTAQSDSSPLGWAEIIHPFHPFRGQRFEVLKARRAAGVDTLILRHPERGSYAVARDWTDLGDPSTVCPADAPAPQLSVDGLLELAALVAQLEAAKGVER